MDCVGVATPLGRGELDVTVEQRAASLSVNDRRVTPNSIWCVGRNYRDHAREMGVDPDREPPIFFGKPTASLHVGGGEVTYPPNTTELHHEVELVALLGRGGANLQPAEAAACVLGVAVGLDLTRRCAQRIAKEHGRPWALAKGFDQSAVCGEFVAAGESITTAGAAIWLRVNGMLRQRASLAAMTWSIPEVIAELSRQITVRAGDIIYTGTPAGVGALHVGDEVVAGIDGIPELRVRIGPAQQA